MAAGPGKCSAVQRGRIGLIAGGHFRQRKGSVRVWEETDLTRLNAGWFEWTFDQIEWTLECLILPSTGQKTTTAQSK